MFHNLGPNVKILRVPLDGTTTYTGSAATTDLTTEGIDTQGYTGCLFMVGFGTITSGAVTSIKAQQSSDDGSTDAYSDLEGTSQTVADDDDNQVFAIDIYRPAKRYLTFIVDRGTQNAVVDFMLAILYHAEDRPVTQPAIVGGLEVFNGPAEGTA